MADPSDDVSAMFKSRKAKKAGKKKFKTFSANKLVAEMQEHGINDDRMDDAAGGPEPSTPVTHGVRSLAASGGRLSLAGSGGGVLAKGLADSKAGQSNSVLSAGEWVDGDATSRPGGSSLVQNSVADLRQETPAVAPAEGSEEEAQERAKREFHLARARAMQRKAESEKAAAGGGAAASEAPAPKPAAGAKWRPRIRLEAKRPETGAAALKELDNEQVFPSLDGPSKNKSNRTAAKANAPATNAVWGQVAADVLEELETAKEYVRKEPKHLGEDFYAAANFEGEKPGYDFKTGESGLGYYWHVAPQVAAEGSNKDEDKDADGGAATKPTKGTWRPRRRDGPGEKMPSDDEGEDESAIAPPPPAASILAGASASSSSVPPPAPQATAPVTSPADDDDDEEEEDVDLSALKKKKKKKKKDVTENED